MKMFLTIPSHAADVEVDVVNIVEGLWERFHTSQEGYLELKMLLASIANVLSAITDEQIASGTKDMREIVEQYLLKQAARWRVTE